MGTRISYPVEVKMKAIQMKLAGKLNEEILTVLNIRNVSQIKTWMKWYKNGELYRLEQPVGKQYTFGKGPEFESETAKLQVENQYLKQQIEVLKITQSWRGSDPKSRSTTSRIIKRNHANWRNIPSLRVARSSYYRWKANRNRQTQKVLRDQQIGEVCKLHKFRYGYRKITKVLSGISEKTVQRVMKNMAGNVV